MKVKQEDEDGASIVEYVSEQLDLNDASLEAFADVFARFQFPPEESSVCLFSTSLSLFSLWLMFDYLVAGQT